MDKQKVKKEIRGWIVTIVAVLAFTADAFDALGSGTGILLTVGIMHNYAEQISKEAAAEQYPALRGFLGLD